MKTLICLARHCLALMLLAGFLVTQAAAAYPDRYITLIVPVPPGGAGDLIGRLVGTKLSTILGQRIVVENRGGAAGTIAAAAASRADADGYTLLLSSSTTHGTAPVVYKNIAYDPTKGFTHIGLVGTVPAVLVVNADLPVKTIQDFVAYAKARPGQLNYGSSGIGSPLHLWGEMFKAAAKIDLTHVPYKGAGPAVVDLLGGRIHAMLDGLPSQLSGINSGKARALGALNATRLDNLPDAPTMPEAGYPDVIGGLWFGLSGPPGLPPDVVKKLEDALKQVVAMPDVQESLKAAGILTTPRLGADYSKFIATENDRYGKVARDAKISVD